MKYVATVADREVTITIDGNDAVSIDDRPVQADLQTFLDGTLHSLLIDGRSYALRIHLVEDSYRVQIVGEIHDVRVEDERTHRLAGLRGSLGVQTGEAVIRAPMPGIIVEVPVTEAQAVKKGDTLIVLESMKMHNEFSAPRDGTVHSIRVAKDQKVEKGTVMVTLA